MRGRRPLLIKSQKALDYLDYLREQVAKLDNPVSGDIRFEADIWYRSRRPDLDPSLIMDGLQGLLYVNDRQIRELYVRGFIDKENPRTVVRIIPLGGDR